MAGVLEIASTSDCIAKGPDEWIEIWTLNELGFFDAVELAVAVVPELHRLQFDIYAYAFLDERFADGVPEPWTLPTLACKAPGDDFEPLGYDVVNKTMDQFFECSPLSCNHGAKTFRANAYCLFDSLGDAVSAAKAFSSGNWEPGPYYVAQVLRRRRVTGR